MSMWRRAMDYLGLGPDDAYDDYDMPAEPERHPRAPRQAGRDEYGRAPRGYSQHDYDMEPPMPARQPPPARPGYPSTSPDVVIRRPAPPTDESTVQPRPINPRPAPPVQRPAAASPAAYSSAEPYTVRPRRFDAAQEIADKFKDGQPVIMNLEATDRETARRLIDFASGLCYGLSGTMEKVATGVYLLKPLLRPSGYDESAYGG